MKVLNEQKETLKQVADLKKQRNQCYQQKKLIEEKFAELVACLINKLSLKKNLVKNKTWNFCTKLFIICLKNKIEKIVFSDAK